MIILIIVIVMEMVMTAMIIVMTFIQEFCIDVSSYSPVTWMEEQVEECVTHFTRCTVQTFQIQKLLAP